MKPGASISSIGPTKLAEGAHVGVVGIPAIAIESNGKTIRFGQGLNAAETRQIIELIRERSGQRLVLDTRACATL